MKKLSLVIAALAMMLGITQCKKQENPVGGKLITQEVTFTTSFGDGSKLGVDEEGGGLDLSWQVGDEIKVTDDAATPNVSTLECTSVSDDHLTGTFKGTITCIEGAQLKFTVGTEPDYMDQHFTAINESEIYLVGESEFQQSGDYGEMLLKLPYAILKVNLAEFAPENGSTNVSVKINEETDPAAVVTDVEAGDCQVYLLLPLTATGQNQTTLTFTNEDETVTVKKSYSLASHGFYTGGGNGGFAPIKPDYLCFTAVEAGAEVKLQKNKSFELHSLQYNINGNEWKDYTFNDKVGETITLTNEGDKVYFRKADSGVAPFSTSASYAKFVMSGEIAASGNVMSLIDPDCEATAIPGTGYCFYNLFLNCTSLTAAPALPATTLTQSCYFAMFQGCSKLTAAPALPATTLTQSCYLAMFQGCTSLTAAPTLPAPTLATSCYSSMFFGCTSLTAAPALPATTLADYCYQYMFNGCSKLTVAPELPVTTLATNCYGYMFQGCTSLTAAPALPATTLAKDCYFGMFSGCSKLTAAPALPAKNLTNGCYLAMFQGCTSLTAAPTLPAPTLATSCYSSMFFGCTSLTAAPALPATTLADYCYQYMFNGCSKLTVAPELPVTTLADYCYQYMFDGCTSLTAAPTLPATTLTQYCYYAMFQGCTSLTAAPTLPAPTLATSCYSSMFFGCTSLTAAPALPATTLARSCYSSMFSGCSKLTAAPALPATNLASSCYGLMFSDCSSLKSITVYFTDWEDEEFTEAWLSGVSETGTFHCPSDLDEEYGEDYIPTGWTVEKF